MKCAGRTLENKGCGRLTKVLSFFQTPTCVVYMRELIQFRRPYPCCQPSYPYPVPIHYQNRRSPLRYMYVVVVRLSIPDRRPCSIHRTREHWRAVLNCNRTDFHSSLGSSAQHQVAFVILAMIAFIVDSLVVFHPYRSPG